MFQNQSTIRIGACRLYVSGADIGIPLSALASSMFDLCLWWHVVFIMNVCLVRLVVVGMFDESLDPHCNINLTLQGNRHVIRSRGSIL
jgi:hypothetical protein